MPTQIEVFEQQMLKERALWTDSTKES